MSRGGRILLLLALTACGKSYGDDGPAPAGSGSTDGGRTFADGSTPSTITCGSETCDLTSTLCCVSGSVNDVKFACTKDDGCNGNPSRCDDAADCPDGQVCCATLSATSFSTVCQKSCSVAQSCKTDAECGTQSCVRQRCVGQAAQLCGQNFFCSPL